MKYHTLFFICITVCFFMSGVSGSGIAAEKKLSLAKPQLRDPMAPLQMQLFIERKPRQKAERRSAFHIQGTGRSARGAYVVMDGEIYREGEAKGSITVVKIGKIKVDIIVSGISYSVPLKET